MFFTDFAKGILDLIYTSEVFELEASDRKSVV